MAYVYRHFIPESTAPKNAVRIGVYKGNERICGIPLGTLAPKQGNPLYSFGLISDLHCLARSSGYSGAKPSYKLDKALSFFEERGVDFVVATGDITNHGFAYSNGSEDLTQFAEFKRICDLHSLPMYPLGGNHDSYFEALDAEKWKEYTGVDMFYLIERENDVLIFLSQSGASIPMSNEAFTFLSETLAENSNKRCFVFVHPLYRNDSGDVNGIYSEKGGGGPLLSKWSRGTELQNLLRQYPKAILFHGHSHFEFGEQAKDKTVNYTNKNGFHSVHIPSLSSPRIAVDGELVHVDEDSQGYIVDVYNDSVVFNGIDLIAEETVLLGLYKLDVAEGT